MNHRLLVSLLLLMPLAVSSASFAPTVPANSEVQSAPQTFVYEYGNRPQALQDLLEPPGATPWTDISVHGTMWQPEARAHFTYFAPYGWGTLARRKTAGGLEWVHLAVPYITYLEDVGQYLRYVEFCAKSSNGAITKPVTMDIYGGPSILSTHAITWPANNAINCFGVYTARVWDEDLGISVQLNFANSTNVITLYKAWAQFQR